jgi:vacuolar-type H+-ATPase subunit I/STV1
MAKSRCKLTTNLTPFNAAVSNVLIAQIAPRSRAARRAASPSLDLDKSLTSLPRAESPTEQKPSVLADRANSGIQKKQKKNDKVSRAQRLRQQKGMDRAEAVMDQLEIKKAKSFARARVIDSRRVCLHCLNWSFILVYSC